MNSLKDKIDHWCEVMEQKAKVQTYGSQNIYFWFSQGKTYYKVMRSDQDSKQNSVHAFINISNGDVYKPSSWSAPYKDVRYNLYNDYDKLLNDCDWAGSYLYKR